VAEALNQERCAVNGSRILVVGVAYKRDVDDLSESPAFDIMRLLQEQGAEVRYHDPYVPRVLEDGKELSSVELTEAALGEADAVVILTDHTAFDYDWIVDHARVLIDARHAVPRAGRDVGTGWVVKS
jgi:UDP-N-acetyl-D-glucosamine dehydrogenase